MLRVVVSMILRTGLKQLCKMPKMPNHLKRKLYKTMLRPVMMYGAKSWAVTKREEGLLERTEMRIMGRILEVLQGKKRNAIIKKRLECHKLLTCDERPD